MSPINLGDLPNNQPAPTGLCQIKRAVSNAGVNYASGTGVVPIQDGTGAPMRISLTPARAGWWLIRAEAIWSTLTATWNYFHWGVRCVPLDANNQGDDRNHMCIHSILGWCESALNTAYRLNAGVAYYAEMYWPNSMNQGTAQIYAGPDYTFIYGEFIEDGSL